MVRKPISQERHAAVSSSPPVAVTSMALLGMIDVIPDAVVVTDTAGLVTMINRQTETLFGYVAEELVGQPLDILIPSRFRRRHERHREGYFAAPHTRPMGIGLELLGLRKDGSEFPVEISLSPIRVDSQLSAISTVRDVSRTKALEAELRERHQEAQAFWQAAEARRQLLQRVIDISPSGIYLVRGPDVRLMLSNQAAERIWGAKWPVGSSMETFLRTSGLAILREDGRPLAFDELVTVRAIHAGKTSQQVQIFRRRDGASLPVLVTVVDLDVALLPWEMGEAALEGERGALVMLQDVTAIKEAEQIKDEFIAIATHELRSPAAVLRGYATMLQRASTRSSGTPLSDWQREAVDSIDSATRQLVELTDELLDLTKLQAGRIELQREPHDLIDLVQREVQRLQVTTNRHTLTVTTNCSPCLVLVDQHRIAQVIGNILGNAIKYSPDGGTVAVSVAVDAHRHEGIVAVRDQGIGIPATQQARLFQRFVRADNARALGIEGTGLGLFLCREFIERHGGRIWFESQEGQGTTFFLALPLLPEPPDGPEHSA
jgi:PAS domain S-box-containing protein